MHHSAAVSTAIVLAQVATHLLQTHWVMHAHRRGADAIALALSSAPYSLGLRAPSEGGRERERERRERDMGVRQRGYFDFEC